MKRIIQQPQVEAWKFYKHDDGSWRWKHRNAANELVGHSDGFKTFPQAFADAKLNGFTEDQKHKIRDL